MRCNWSPHIRVSSLNLWIFLLRPLDQAVGVSPRTERKHEECFCSQMVAMAGNPFSRLRRWGGVKWGIAGNELCGRGGHDDGKFFKLTRALQEGDGIQ